MEQVVFLLILGVVAFIRWLYERSQEAQARRDLEQGEDRSTLPPRGPAEISEAERMRRFMEALGIPQGEAPPPVPERPRPAAPPAVPAPLRPRAAPPTPPSLPEGFEVQQTQRSESSMERKIAEAEAATLRAGEEARRILARIPQVTPTVKPPPISRSAGPARVRGGMGANIRHRLRDPQLTAESIVLAEILGPPRALAPHRAARAG